jgi:GGDEF domain-containing protein
MLNRQISYTYEPLEGEPPGSPAAADGTARNHWPEVVEQLLAAALLPLAGGEQGGDAALDGQVSELRNALAGQPDPAELLALSAALSGGLEQCRRRKRESQQRLLEEYRKTLRLMAGILSETAARPCPPAEMLEELSAGLDGANAEDEAGQLSSRFEPCLEELRRELASRNHALGSATAAPECGGEPAAPAATEIPGRGQAQEVILACCQESGPGPRTYFVGFHVQRMELTNMRYGHKFGDEILAACGLHIASHLKPTDRLFRWTGPAFLAILKRSDSQSAIQSEMGRIAGSPKLTREVEAGGRSMILSIGLASLTLAAAELSGPEVILRLDQFAARDSFGMPGQL